MSRPRISTNKRVSSGEAPRAADGDYVVLGVSMKCGDLRRLDAMVDGLRVSTPTMSRSRLIRIAIAKLDVATIEVES